MEPIDIVTPFEKLKDHVNLPGLSAFQNGYLLAIDEAIKVARTLQRQLSEQQQEGK